MDGSQAYRRSAGRSPMYFDDGQNEDVNPLSLFPAQPGTRDTQSQRRALDTEFTGLASLKETAHRPFFGLTQSSQLSENALQHHVEPGRLPTSCKQSSLKSEPHIPGASGYSHTPTFYDSKGHYVGKGSTIRLKEESPLHDVDYMSQTRVSSRASPSGSRNPAARASYYEPSSKGDPEDQAPPSDSHNEDEWISKISSNLRQSKNEVAALRQHNAEVRKQLEIKERLNSELSLRLQTSKKACEAFQKDNAGLRVDFESLRTKYQASAAFLLEARTTMQSIAQLRASAQSDLERLVSKFDEEGEYVKGSATKNLVDELQSELSKTQQVADLLREKLDIMGAELAEARSRIAELEDHHINDTRALESATADLLRSAQHMVDMDDRLKLHKREAMDTIVNLAEAQQQSSNFETRSREMATLVDSLKHELSESEPIYHEQKSQLRVLHNTVTFQEQRIKDLEARILKAEEEHNGAQVQVRDLQDKLATSHQHEMSITAQYTQVTAERDILSGRVDSLDTQLTDIRDLEKSLSAQSARLSSERDSLRDKCKSAELQLADTKRELESHRGRLHESEIACKVLEERFDEQSITLRITKESIGDVEERLYVAENAKKTSGDTFSGVISGLERAVCLSKERESVLQVRLNEAIADNAVQREEILKFREKIARAEGDYQAKLSGAEARVQETEVRVREAEAQAQEARDQLREKERVNDRLNMELTERDSQLQGFQQRLSIAEAPSDDHEKTIDALDTRIRALDATVKSLQDRAGNITLRYNEDDLNDDERVLVSTLTQQARTVFEREIVEKSNEIRRRDNLIKQHEARILQLQDSLQRRIRIDGGINGSEYVMGGGPDASQAQHAALGGLESTSTASWGGPPALPDAGSNFQPRWPMDQQPELRKQENHNLAAENGVDYRPTASTTEVFKSITPGETPFRGALPTPTSDHGVPRLGQESDRFSFRTLAMDDPEGPGDFDDPPSAPQIGKRAMALLGDEDAKEFSRPARRPKNTTKIPEVETVTEKTSAAPKKKAGRRYGR
ncbi:hypothetical protein BV22DRAFT_1130464 [Leucogyrophana mollusca]|uniref:Uncharacterized protein n=1 Tax=Leucogyrophana mollusca TaxID=85980 RepID=A0ACB8BDW7_9AGAM|nr:hypothetical protein BV22DRAFT_1130464 [Leucogyrophana mollusca]